MLDWKQLDTGQRVLSAVFLVFIASFWFVCVLGHLAGFRASGAQWMGLLAVSAGMLGTLLNPEAVRGLGTAFDIQHMPTPCRALYVVASLSLVAMLLS